MKTSKLTITFDEENKVSRNVPYAVAKHCKDIMVSKIALAKLQDLFHNVLEQVISKTTLDDTDIRCYKTPMAALPSGAEKGNVLALNYAGDFLQLAHMQVFGNRKFDMEVEVYPLPSKVLDATMTEVLTFAAECTDTFLTKYSLENELPMSMGVAVNLPLRYDDRKVFLAKPTDQFSYPEALQEDMVEILENALGRLGLEVKIVGFVNNTTGSLLANNWKNPQCKVGLLTGDGTSLCYIENADNVHMASKPKDTQYAFIELDNGEFGINGELDFIKCDADIELEGLYPNLHAFEKMVSAKYLGELVRLKMNELIGQNLMLRGIGSARLLVPNNFRREFVILIEK